MANQSLLQQAMSLHEAGRLEEAESQYRAVLAQQPFNPDVQHMLAIVLLERGNAAGAVALAEQAAAARSNVAVVQLTHGRALRGVGRLEEAEAAFRRSLALDATSIPATTGLARVLAESDRAAEAESILQAAIEREPARAVLHSAMGKVYVDTGRPAEAVACYRRALALRPELPEGMNNLSDAIEAVESKLTVIDDCRFELELMPSSIRAHFHLFSALLDRAQDGDLAEAEHVRERAEALEPSDANDWLALSNMRHAFADTARARPYLDKAIALAPTEGKLHWNRALMMLEAGNYAEGWREFEWRLDAMPQLRKNFWQPRWRGEDIRGRTILLHQEGGFGDVIQFARYVPMVAARGATVMVGCKPELMSLLRSAPGVSRVVEVGEGIPPFDVYSPLQSLPLVMGTTSLAQIPMNVPYLQPSEEGRAKWKRLVGERSRGELRVGLCWAGSAGDMRSQRRTRALAAFSSLFGVPGITFYSLQKGAEAADAAAGEFPIIDLNDERADFEDAAALMEQLDLVVSVDSAPAHLAGALGRAVWVLVTQWPDFRWMWHRTDSPWYPTMRLFRRGLEEGWPPVFSRVADELREWAALERQKSPSP
jgi:tetratricopeptide (TPR) repeat protein